MASEARVSQDAFESAVAAAAAETRVSQEAIEVIASGLPADARVSQEIYEAIVSSTTVAGVTQMAIEAIIRPAPPEPLCTTELDIKGFTSCVSGGLLGDGTDLRVLLVYRGMTGVIAELKPISGEFTRNLDATSTLSMQGVVSGMGSELCCEGWDDVRTWATEIIVYRDGRDAWAGPVTDIAFDNGRISIEADDLTAWWDRRVVPTMNFVNEDLTTIFLAIHEAAMAPDDSPNINIISETTGITGTRNYNGNVYQYAADAIEELAQTGVDYTAYGRNIIVGGEQVDVAPFVTLLDEHWTEPPRVRDRGNEQATVVVVKGQGVQAVAVAPPEYIDYYGYIVRVFDESNITDTSSAEISAQSHLELLKSPTFIETPSGASLKSTAPITVEQMIPGMVIRVDTQSTCRRVVGDFRLEGITVNFNGEVAISLQPLGFDGDSTSTVTST